MHYIKRHFFLIIGLGLISLRFCFVSDSSFIADEPQLQRIVDDVLITGKLPLYGLTGSQPIPYGPVPLWIYTALRTLIGQSHELLFYSYCFIQTCSLFLFLWLSTRLFKYSTASMLFALGASSPFLFYYARLCWDNSFLILFSTITLSGLSLATAGLGKQQQKLFLIGCSVWALGLGLSLGTHLMILPLALSTTLFLFFACLQKILKKQMSWQIVVTGFAVSISILFIILTPYLYGIFVKSSAQSTLHQSTHFLKDIRDFRFILQKMLSYLNFMDFSNYFLESTADLFFKEKLGLLFLQFSKIYYIVFDVTLLICGFALVLSVKGVQRFTLMFCFLVILTQEITYTTLGHYRHPHYYNYLYWLPLALLAPLLEKWSSVFSRLAFVLLCMNIYFLINFLSFVHDNKGSRGLYYGLTISSQQTAIDQICVSAQEEKLTTIKLDISQINVVAHSLHYFFLRDPNCKNLNLEFSSPATYKIEYSKEYPSAEIKVIKNI